MPDEISGELSLTYIVIHPHAAVRAASSATEAEANISKVPCLMVAARKRKMPRNVGFGDQVNCRLISFRLITEPSSFFFIPLEPHCLTHDNRSLFASWHHCALASDSGQPLLFLWSPHVLVATTLWCEFVTVTDALQIFRAPRSNLQPVARAENATNEWVLTRRGPAAGSLIKDLEQTLLDVTSVLVYPSFALTLNPTRKTNLPSSSPLRKL